MGIYILHLVSKFLLFYCMEKHERKEQEFTYLPSEECIWSGCNPETSGRGYRHQKRGVWYEWKRGMEPHKPAKAGGGLGDRRKKERKKKKRKKEKKKKKKKKKRGGKKKKKKK